MDWSESKRRNPDPIGSEASASRFSGDRESSAVVLLDISGAIVGANQECEFLSGYSTQDLIGRHYSFLFGILSDDSFLRLVDLEGDQQIETRLTQKSSMTIPVGVRVSRVSFGTGPDEYVVMVSRVRDRDVTNGVECGVTVCLIRKEYEDNLMVAAHDTRGPLTTIRGYLSMIDGSELSAAHPQLAEMVRGALGATNRLEDIVRLIAKGAISDSQESKRYIFLSDVASKAVDGLAHELRRNGASIVVENLGYAFVDPDEITEVFQNLIENAIKYGHPPDVPAKIRISQESSEADDFVRVVVSDSGPGIDADDPTRFFEAFQGSGGVDGSLGLGLAISKRYVGDNGGSIWVESEDGGGSRFCFTLPRRRLFHSKA